MSTLPFTANSAPTLGVEVELQLVDAETGALANRFAEVADRVPAAVAGKVKPELMRSYLEINTGVCRDVAEVRADLAETLAALRTAADGCGTALLWAGTHPFSHWADQQVTTDERYHRLVELMQDVARRLVTFGLHVHVGVDSGDKAVMLCDRLTRHLPLLLALTSNSPFWGGRHTGLCSNRSKVMEALPTAGLPQRMRNYSEYVWLVNHLVDTGFINSIREIWWDVRPHHNFGTVEVRVCDVPCDLDQVVAITALVQCLTVAISLEIDGGTYYPEYHPMMIEQNKWRAARYGPAAMLVDSASYRSQSVGEVVEDLIARLSPTAAELGCTAELESVRALPAANGAARQSALWHATGDAREVVRGMLGD